MPPLTLDLGSPFSKYKVSHVDPALQSPSREVQPVPDWRAPSISIQGVQQPVFTHSAFSSQCSRVTCPSTLSVRQSPAPTRPGQVWSRGSRKSGSDQGLNSSLTHSLSQSLGQLCLGALLSLFYDLLLTSEAFKTCFLIV